MSGVLKKDDNGYPVSGGVSSTNSDAVLNMQIDPITGRVLVDNAGSTGVASINGDTTAAQIIAVGTAGTDVAISNAVAGTTTINIPTASATNRGALSSADWSTFNGKGSGTVTAVSVATANGVSGSSSGGSTPALTIALGAITPSSVNGNTITTGTGTLTLGSYTLTVANTASVSGTNTGDNTVATAIKSPATTGVATFTGPAAGETRVMTIPDANTTLVGEATTQTLTNKRITPRIGGGTTYTTDTGTSIASDTQDMFIVTAQAGDLLFNNPSGTPTDGQKLIISVASSTTAARALTWGNAYGATTVALPTTTAATTATLTIGFIWSASKSLWQCVAVA